MKKDSDSVIFITGSASEGVISTKNWVLLFTSIYVYKFISLQADACLLSCRDCNSNTMDQIVKF